MTDDEKPAKCRQVGVCRLPHGHGGICLYLPHSVAAPTIAHIGVRDGLIFVDVGAPGPWQVITLTPAQAFEFGAALLRRAYTLLIHLAEDVH